MKQHIQLMKLIFNFLDKLSDEDIQSLLNGNSNLVLKNKKKLSTTPPIDISYIKDISEKITSNTNVADAKKYLDTLKLNKATLKDVCKYNDIHINSKDNINKIKEKIIDNTVGAKLKFDTLLNTSLK